MSIPAKKITGPCTIGALAEFVSRIVAQESGNVLGQGQQSMVESRLRKRLLDLGSVSPEQYYNYLLANYQKESSQLISMLTTHHTFFFREFSHFEFVLKSLDGLVERAKARGEKKIRVLSAACSRGQEVYSLGMFLKKHLSAYPEMDFEIVGTDIDPECVKFAKNGVFAYREVKTIPQVYLEGNWQRGKGEIAAFAKVKDTIKSKCKFSVMNLLSLGKTLGASKFDIVFCRNVFIYFKPDDIAKIVSNFKRHIHHGGFLITGLSESLKEISPELVGHAPSVYSYGRAPEQTEVRPIKEQASGKRGSGDFRASIPSPVRMLVVDDSPSVVKLLSKIFESDPEFELAGTASNGVEAARFLKDNKVDAMTLDIHMPEMDGVEYLKKHHGVGHPKVIVVSSASREDTRYAQQTLRHGAIDFVEKPALNNLAQRAEEIKNKIKMSFLNQEVRGDSLGASFERDFVIQNPETKARILFANYSDVKKVKSFLSDLKGPQAPLFLVFEGNGNYLEMIREELGLSAANAKIGPESPAAGSTYLCDFDAHMQGINSFAAGKRVSCAIFGIVSGKASDALMELSPGQLLLEDIPGINAGLLEVADDVFPWTSFAHIGTEFLSKGD